MDLCVDACVSVRPTVVRPEAGHQSVLGGKNVTVGPYSRTFQPDSSHFPWPMPLLISEI